MFDVMEENTKARGRCNVELVINHAVLSLRGNDNSEWKNRLRGGHRSLHIDPPIGNTRKLLAGWMTEEHSFLHE